MQSVTSIRECQASLGGLSTNEVQMCLQVEASASVKVTASAEAKHCKKDVEKTDSKSAFSDRFNDRCKTLPLPLLPPPLLLLPILLFLLFLLQLLLHLYLFLLFLLLVLPFFLHLLLFLFFHLFLLLLLLILQPFLFQPSSSFSTSSFSHLLSSI